MGGLLQERGHLKEWETAKIAHDILRVLCECHRQNICYADVKPANFLLKEPYHSGWNEDGPQVKVADFGCSQRFLKVSEPCCPVVCGVALVQLYRVLSHYAKAKHIAV